MVNVGVIGLGRVVREFHIPSLLRIKEVKIKGICARTETKEKLSLASDIGANFYQDYEEMFERENLKAVYVCSPTIFHKEMTITALKRGYHVFCEKPIAMNVDEAKAMCNKAGQSSRILFNGYNRRFSPTYQKVKKFSQQKRINIFLLEKIRGEFVNMDKAVYNRIIEKQIKLLGSEIMEFGVHFVDLAKWIGGKVTKTYFSSNKISGVPACAGNGIAVFEHEKGQKSIMYFTLAGGKSSERSVAIADDSTCQTFGGMFGKSQVIISKGDRVEKFQSSDDTLVAGGFLQENRCFIDSVSGKKRPPYEPEDTIDTLRLSLEWAESYKVAQES